MEAGLGGAGAGRARAVPRQCRQPVPCRSSSVCPGSLPACLGESRAAGRHNPSALHAVPWGTALLSLKLMAKRHLASAAAAAGWALLRDLMQNRMEMESAGTSCEALCLPIHLRVFYVFLLSPSKSLLGCCSPLEGQSRAGAGAVSKPRSYSGKAFCAWSHIWATGDR